jgi:hypothetical protein
MMMIIDDNDGESMFLVDISIYLQVNTSSQPRKPTSTKDGGNMVLLDSGIYLSLHGVTIQKIHID